MGSCPDTDIDPKNDFKKNDKKTIKIMDQYIPQIIHVSYSFPDVIFLFVTFFSHQRLSLRLGTVSGKVLLYKDF